MVGVQLAFGVLAQVIFRLGLVPMLAVSFCIVAMGAFAHPFLWVFCLHHVAVFELEAVTPSPFHLDGH